MKIIIQSCTICSSRFFSSSGDSEGFHCFLKAVLYVGKGKRARPYSHFKEAIKQLKNPHLRVGILQCIIISVLFLLYASFPVTL